MTWYSHCLTCVLTQAKDRRRRDSKLKRPKRERWTEKTSGKKKAVNKAPAKKAGAKAALKRQRGTPDQSEEVKSEEEMSIGEAAPSKTTKRAKTDERMAEPE